VGAEMRRYIFASLLAFALLFSMFFSAACTSTTSVWSIQTLDDYTFKNHGFVAVDSHNNPHIVYYMHDLTNRYATGEIIEEIKYVRWNGSDWDITIVIPSGGVSRDFKLDSNDNPHILYTETIGPQRFITYATWTEENGWVNSRVDGDYGGWGNLALDTTGKPHVAYFMGEEMRYASWTGTSWDIKTVNTPEPLEARLNPPTFFEFDSEDNAHLMYTTESHSIAYIVGDGVNWNVSTFEGYDLVDVELDSAGNPHIVYLESVHPKKTKSRFMPGGQERVGTPKIFKYLLTNLEADMKKRNLP
jgi:hypothetical protein